MKAKLVSVLICLLFLAGCSAETSDVSEVTAVTDETSDVSEVTVVTEAGVTESPEDLFDRFAAGEIDAEFLTSSPVVEGRGSVNFNDLDYDPDNIYMSFRVGEQIDLDNDGENELIIDGPYGGMYLDAIDGNLYVFAQALGNGGSLSYTFYDDAMWIVISDITHAGRAGYVLYKFEGGDNLVDRISLMAENYYEDQEGVYTFNDEPVTEEEYTRIHDEMFGG